MKILGDILIGGFILSVTILVITMTIILIKNEFL